MKIILFVLLFLVGLYFGILLGIKDCKRTFNIPKGVKNLEEWQESIDIDCSADIT